MKSITSLIQIHQLTFEAFSKLTILSEHWLEEVEKQQKPVPHDSYNMGVLFTIYQQGDRKVYFEKKVAPLKKEKSVKSLPELIETKSRDSADLDNVLQECVINCYESEMYQYCFKLGAILGATVTNEIMPHFTTHVVTSYFTPQLKRHLQTI